MKPVSPSTAGGALLALLGGVVMFGWWMQSSPLVSVLPGFTPMVFNTALCFVLAGSALLTPVSDAVRYRRVTTAIGGVLAIIAALVLAEHLLQTNLGIDWAPLHAWLNDSNPNAGRMSSGTACGFLMSGAVLILATRVRRPWVGTLVRLLTLGVGFSWAWRCTLPPGFSFSRSACGPRGGGSSGAGCRCLRGRTTGSRSSAR